MAGQKQGVTAMEKNAVLVLQDGTIAEGFGFGSEGMAKGEVVFNTSMTGYQEALTDPSYRYQILMPTYPLIGNYGINKWDFESDRIQVEGFIVRETAEKPVHGRIKSNIDEFLREHNVPGIQGIDTRFLTRKIRVNGVMNGILKYPYGISELEDLRENARNLKSISEFDLIDLVSTKRTKKYDAGGEKTIILVDCGEKQSIVRSVLERRINVIQVPAKTHAEEIMDHSPDGIIISNGPGDPERAGYVVETVKKLIEEKIPIFGICLGIQIIGLAFGAKTYKLKFGHRGSNQPVKDLRTGRVYITSQNHGFAVDGTDLKVMGIEVTHINLNDKSVEGFSHKELPVRGVQYHPEAHPGPWDSCYLFDEFAKMIG